MKPAISVAMPYWNRPEELARSLASYAKCYPDLDIEFSLCDDGSDRPPGRLPRNAKLTKLPAKTAALNPCVPINRAVRAATRDVIVLTNPETEHREPVLYAMLEALTGPNDYVMTGARNAPYQYRRGLVLKESPGEWVAGPEAPRAPVGGRKPIAPGSELHFCTMFHRALFERAGGFDEAYRNGAGCEDNDFTWRLYAAGANFKYVPGAVWHYVTRHGWKGKPGVNYELLDRKWGHLPEYRCA
ncbi:MAG TPA: glycosyltransferase [Stellaceae bacterium]|nr:glycosyltransferase [Terriglobia bacterium]HEV2551792.1 glycosyltransferase [Stellaceae bacterium]